MMDCVQDSVNTMNSFSKIRKGGEPILPFLAQQFVAYYLKIISFTIVIHFTASFNALPAVNLGTFLAAIKSGLLISVPHSIYQTGLVFCGFSLSINNKHSIPEYTYITFEGISRDLKPAFRHP